MTPRIRNRATLVHPRTPWRTVSSARARPCPGGLTVHDGRHGSADEHSRVADPGGHHSRHGLGRHGDGESHLVGLVHCGDLRDRDLIWRAADRGLGSWDVWCLAVSERNTGLTADPLFVGATRPPMRWGVTYSALLVNGVFTMEVFLLTKNLLTLALALPVHGICALLCARDARFFDLLLLLGAYPNPGADRKRPVVESEHLQSIDARPPERDRRAGLRPLRGFNAQGPAAMSALPIDAQLRGECRRRIAFRIWPTFPRTWSRRALGTTCRYFGLGVQALNARMMRRSTPSTSV